MNYRICMLMIYVLMVSISGCGSAEQSPTAESHTTSDTSLPSTESSPSAVPTQDLAALFAAQGGTLPDINLSHGVSGIGNVKTKDEADMVFIVSGTVEKVYVEEGDHVYKDQLLAVLDVRTFDHQVNRAQAALIIAQAQKNALTEPPRQIDVTIADAQVRQAQAAVQLAQAQQSALYEPPRAADVAAADAQIRQAEASLAQVLAPPDEVDVRAAEASRALAQINLQAMRNQLSFAKTQAEFQVTQSAYALTQSQWGYALSQRYWEHADEQGTDPKNPTVENPVTGKAGENEISEGMQASYLSQYEQAKAGMQYAEAAVNQAVTMAESARANEVTGVQAAEQQVVQAQAGYDRVVQAPDEHDVALAQASVDVANANRQRINPDPTGSQQSAVAAQIAQAQAALDQAIANRERVATPDPKESQLTIAEAGIMEAESGLALAQLNREYAELRAPFDGIISEVNIDPGDLSSGFGKDDAAVQLINLDDMYIEVDISDVDIVNVEKDQRAMVYADALPGNVFYGKVSYVSPTTDVKGNIRTYQVWVQMDDMGKLRPGMSVRVEIETEPAHAEPQHETTP